MLSRIGRWLRGNAPMLAVAAVVVASVVGAGALILSVASRQDPLREAEVGLGELNALARALSMHPQNVFDRGLAAGSDLTANRRIRTSAIRAADRVEANWDNRTSRLLQAQTQVTAALSLRTLGLVDGGRLAAARRSLGRLASSAAELVDQVRRSRALLSSDTRAVQSGTSTGMFAITGVLGVALVLLTFTVSASRRRRARDEAEQRTLRKSERRLQALVGHGSDVIVVVAPDTTVLYGAGAVKATLGYDPRDLQDRKLSELLVPGDAPALAALCANADGSGLARELRLRHRDGTTRTCEARATSLLGDELWNGIVLNIWDVSERKELEERLRRHAFHDGLTGLANRVLFGERLEHALVRGLRAGHAVTVLLIDLDDFKAINDSLGHPAGDRLLREVAKRIDSAMRSADTIARLGGDEFAVIIDESPSPAHDEEVAQRVIDAIGRPIRLDGRAFPVTASVGIARSAPSGSDAAELVRDADLAMYSAKFEEKGTYAVYRDDMHIATEDRLQLKADLLRALASDDQLTLHYQPVVTLRDGEIVGLEALLRWNHPNRGQIGPAEFVHLAEESGAIVPIGRWVLREACRQARDWIERTDRQLLISVNVSARQLRAPGLLDDVRSALEQSGLAPQSLVLEITESELMHDISKAKEILLEIRRLGVRVAIDDFGTGYSSLGHLERLPADILKVDRHLAGAADDQGEHSRLLRAVMEIGQSLNLSTVAEGIETPAQLEELRALEYSFGQGYLFSRPLPGAAVEPVLAGGSIAAGQRLGAAADGVPTGG